ncbi:uncharacterized protein LOC144909658 [Branchiostoma floridae x Branchiostoma belcheri]
MACGRYSEHYANSVRLAALLIKKGTPTLLSYLLDNLPRCDDYDNPCLPCTHEFRTHHLRHVLQLYSPLLKHLRFGTGGYQKVLGQQEYEQLYPLSGIPCNPHLFSFTLLFTLIRHLCGPRDAGWPGWDRAPLITEKSPEYDVIRLRQFQDVLYSHLPRGDVRGPVFAKWWTYLSAVLIRLGLREAEIERFRLEVEVVDEDTVKFLVEMQRQYREERETPASEKDYANIDVRLKPAEDGEIDRVFDSARYTGRY